MSPRLLLDTHIWFRLQVVPGKLKPSLIAQIERAALDGNVFVSVISVWELALLELKGRLDLGGSAERWCMQALDRPGISMIGLTSQIAIDAVQLPKPMHKDSADRFLVSSARLERLTLVTQDRLLLRLARTIALPCLHA